MDRTSKTAPFDAEQAEVERLQAEIAELREQLAQARAARPNTAAANAMRSARSAALDAKVWETARECLSEAGFCGTDLPAWLVNRYLRWKVVNMLNERGIPAPRGGTWSVRQVQRAWLRHAGRAIAKPAGNPPANLPG